MKLLRELSLRRNHIAVLAFFGFVNIYILRANLSIAIVAMTQKYEKITENGSIQYVQDFYWNSKEKGNILGAFFYGYICTQVIGGWMGEKIGGALVFGTGVLITAILNLGIPFAAHYGIEYLIIIRAIEGIFEGAAFPCFHVIWSKWAPAEERTRLVAFGFAGMFAGIVIAFPMCGFIAQKFGWSAIFYITGIIAMVWYLFWFIFVKNNPEDDPWISESELKYIKGSLKNSVKVTVYPWKSILTSMPVWAIVFAQSCETWGLYTMLTQLPTFISDVSNVNIQSIGFLTAIPYLVMCITLPLSGFLVDEVRKRNLYTTTQVRKIVNTFAYVAQAVFITCAGFMESAYTIILCITLAFGLGACAWSAVMVNHLDIAPQYVGVLMGIANTFASIPGFVSPILTGYIVQNKTKEEWRTVLYITAVIYLFGATIFAIFSSGERQSWARNESVEEPIKSDSTIFDINSRKMKNIQARE